MVVESFIAKTSESTKSRLENLLEKNSVNESNLKDVGLSLKPNIETIKANSIQQIVEENKEKMLDVRDAIAQEEANEARTEELSEDEKVNKDTPLEKEVASNINVTECSESEIIFSSLDDMKDKLNENYKDLKANKPMNSPNIAKWFENGGEIAIYEQDKKPVWTYINPEGISVKYVDGYPIFPPETKHPVIEDLNIGEFTGDRYEDKKIYLEILEEEYGLTEIPEGYALHHDSEIGTMQLVKEEYHKEFTHAGGHSKFKEGTEC